jgi:hypothetical protein
MKYVKVHKPGTSKTQLVEVDKVDFYKQYGWEPVVTEVKASVKPRKTAQSKPAVDEVVVATESDEEVGTDDTKGE